MHFSILATSILIAAGACEPMTAYILHLEFDRRKEEITGYDFENLMHLPFSSLFTLFGGNVCGRCVLIGKDGFEDFFSVVELLKDGWKTLSSSSSGRIFAAACYMETNKCMYVSGGYDKRCCILDTIERLYIDENSTADKWEVLQARLPYNVRHHTMTTLGDEMYLIGGNEDWGRNGFTNRVWKGTLSDHDEIEFTEMEAMKIKRSNHFAVSFQGEIHVFGGERNCPREFPSCVEIFKNQKWEMGPELPFYLQHSYDRENEIQGYGNAVMNSNGMIIIMSNTKGLAVYNPLTLKVQYYDIKMREDNRMGYSATVIDSLMNNKRRKQ